MTSPTHSLSKPPAIESCCFVQLLSNRPFQITLLAASILAIVLGSVYLEGIPRTFVVITGAIFCALFVIGVVKERLCSYLFPQREESFASPEKEEAAIDEWAPLPTSDTPPPRPAGLYNDEELERDPLGKTLLAATSAKFIGVVDCSYHCSEGKKRGWTVYFQDTASNQPPLRVLLVPRPSTSTPNGIGWESQAYPKSDQKRLEATFARANCTRKHDLASFVNGSFDSLKLLPDPQANNLMKNKIF